MKYHLNGICFSLLSIHKKINVFTKFLGSHESLILLKIKILINLNIIFTEFSRNFADCKPYQFHWKSMISRNFYARNVIDQTGSTKRSFWCSKFWGVHAHVGLRLMQFSMPDWYTAGSDSHICHPYSWRFHVGQPFLLRTWILQ